jgi:hypothetical protein
MAKPEVMQRAESSWSDLWAHLDRLSPGAWELPSGQSEWSPREVLAHITRWEEWAGRRIPARLRGEPGAQLDVDSINAGWMAEDRVLPLMVVRERAPMVHQELMLVLESVAPDSWDDAIEATAVGNTWDHYEEHLKSLTASGAASPEAQQL